MRRRARVVVGLIAFALAAAACGEPNGEAPLPTSGPADPTDERAVARGEALYRTHCASCHGDRLQGQPNWQGALPDGGYPAPPHDGSGHTWRHADGQLFEATKFGGSFSAGPGVVSHMPAFEAVLSDDEIWAALAYVKSHWPAQLLARQRLLTRIRSRNPQADREAHAGHEGHIGNASEAAK